MSEPVTLIPVDTPTAELLVPAGPRTPAGPTAKFMFSHPAHVIALGMGSGLSRIAPGTSGTLWAWIAFIALSQWLGEFGWGVLIALSLPIGWWASTVTARHMGVLDPGQIVIDEVGLFRYFDATKPGPVGWADRLFHGLQPEADRHAWSKAGWGIMLDDLVAAGCTLLVVALWRFL
jgi:phosphatidylglycerophosphatase A